MTVTPPEVGPPFQIVKLQNWIGHQTTQPQPSHSMDLPPKKSQCGSRVYDQGSELLLPDSQSSAPPTGLSVQCSLHACLPAPMWPSLYDGYRRSPRQHLPWWAGVRLSHGVMSGFYLNEQRVEDIRATRREENACGLRCIRPTPRLPCQL